MSKASKENGKKLEKDFPKVNDKKKEKGSLKVNVKKDETDFPKVNGKNKGKDSPKVNGKNKGKDSPKEKGKNKKAATKSKALEEEEENDEQSEVEEVDSSAIDRAKTRKFKQMFDSLPAIVKEAWQVLIFGIVFNPPQPNPHHPKDRIWPIILGQGFLLSYLPPEVMPTQLLLAPTW